MTLTKDFASKLAVALVAVAMVFSAFASSAKAQTTEELQQMINDLLAQVAALQASTGQGGTSVASGVCPYVWTRDLNVGASGADVMKLQQFLNADVDTRVSASGVGSVGAETEFYGPLTAAAVNKLQVKYRSDILSPNALVNPTGYFGPSSRAKANGLCTSAPATTDDTTTDDTTADDSDVTLGGSADLNDFAVDSADDSTVEEGHDDVEIGAFTINFKNGDAEVDRLDIGLDHTSGTEANPWDAFDTVSLWVDGDKIAEVDANTRRDYLDENTSDGTLRFSHLGLIAMEDEDVVVTVAANLQKGNNGDNDWSLTAESMRYFDADGVASTEDGLYDLSGDTPAVNASGDATADFTIQEAGTNDEVIVKTNSNNPDASTLEVKDNAKSDWYTTLVFDLDTNDSVNDITLNHLFVDVVVSSGTYATLVDDAEIIVDGTTISSNSSDVTAATTTAVGDTGRIDFNVDGDVVINAGDRVKVEVRLKFNSLALGNEGVTVKTSETATNVDAMDAEGTDTLTNTAPDQLTGAAAGKDMTLRTQGIDGSAVSMNSALTTSGYSGSHDYVTYTMKVDVTAFNQDVYISKTAATSLVYDKTDSSGTGLSSTGSTTVDSFTSTANDTDAAGYYHVPEGSTDTFTIVVKWAPGIAWSATGIQLTSIKYAETATTAGLSTWSAVPASDYRTGAVSTNN